MATLSITKKFWVKALKRSSFRMFSYFFYFCNPPINNVLKNSNLLLDPPPNFTPIIWYSRVNKIFKIIK